MFNILEINFRHLRKRQENIDININIDNEIGK